MPAQRPDATPPVPTPEPEPSQGLALVLLGMTALLCAARGPAAEPAWVRPDQAGQPLALALGQLRGDDFRLLPGVGPALAERLEAARIAAGGALHAADLDRVPGVGPVRAARWRALTDPKAPGPAGRVDAVR